MNTIFNLKIWPVMAALALLSACGGGDVAINPNANPGDAETAAVSGLNGIWEGDYTDASGTLCTGARGLIYNGQVRVVSEKCDVVLSGTLSVSGDTASINFELFDASVTGTGQSVFSGSYTLQSLIEGSLDNGARLSLRYQTVYENDSSLARLADTWFFGEVDATAINIIAIDAGGNSTAFSKTGEQGGCSYSVSFSIIDADYNLYAVNIGVSNCVGNLTGRNGVYTGVASLSGDDSGLTVLAGNDQNVFFAYFQRGGFGSGT